MTECRRLLSAMRSATARHQAEWPAVRVGEVDHLYRKSALRVQEANHAFGTWLQTQINQFQAQERVA